MQLFKITLDEHDTFNRQWEANQEAPRLLYADLDSIEGSAGETHLSGCILATIDHSAHIRLYDDLPEPFTLDGDESLAQRTTDVFVDNFREGPDSLEDYLKEELWEASRVYNEEHPEESLDREYAEDHQALWDDLHQRRVSSPEAPNLPGVDPIDYEQTLSDFGPITEENREDFMKELELYQDDGLVR